MTAAPTPERPSATSCAFYVEAGRRLRARRGAGRPFRGSGRAVALPRAPDAGAARPRRPRRARPAPRPARQLAAARRGGHGGARGGEKRRHARRAARDSWTRFDGCALKHHGEAARLRRRQPEGAPDVRRRGARARRGHRRACRSSGAPASCSTRCWARSGSSARASISPISSRGGRRATATPRRTRPRSACPSSSGRSSWSIPRCWSVSASRRRDAARGDGRHPRTRGRWFAYDTGTREIRAMATFHPAYLLRSPHREARSLADFLAIKKALAASRLVTGSSALARMHDNLMLCSVARRHEDTPIIPDDRTSPRTAPRARMTAGEASLSGPRSSSSARR